MAENGTDAYTKFVELYKQDIEPVLEREEIFKEWSDDYKTFGKIYRQIPEIFELLAVIFLILSLTFTFVFVFLSGFVFSNSELYYPIFAITVPGVIIFWYLATTTRKFFRHEQKKKEWCYKRRIFELGIYRKILECFSCSGDYAVNTISQKISEKSDILENLNLINADDVFTATYKNIPFKVIDYLCLCTQGKLKYNVNNLVMIIEKPQNYNEHIILKESMRETAAKSLCNTDKNKFPEIYNKFKLLKKKFPDNDISLEFIDNKIIFCVYHTKDFFEFCNLTENETINCDTFKQFFNDINLILSIVDLFEIQQ